MVKKRRERSDRKAENKKRPDVDKFHVTVLISSFVLTLLISDLSLFLSLKFSFCVFFC